jgi:hypothetical protein
MNDDGNDDIGGVSGRQQRAGPRRAVVLAAALASLALLAAACGGGGSSTAGGTPYQQALAYAQCMRSSGEPGFPDPNSQGLFQNFGPVDIHSSQYLSANNACGHLLPTYKASTAQQRQTLGRQLKYAACFRSHGFPDTRDPILLPNGNLEGAGPGGAAGPGNPVDTNSPQYKSAQQACLPFLTGARS